MCPVFSPDRCPMGTPIPCSACQLLLDHPKGMLHFDPDVGLGGIALHLLLSVQQDFCWGEVVLPGVDSVGGRVSNRRRTWASPTRSVPWLPGPTPTVRVGRCYSDQDDRCASIKASKYNSYKRGSTFVSNDLQATSRISQLKRC